MGGTSRLDLEILYGLCWNNPVWNPQRINASNVVDYFCDRTNPFYDRECNNEVIRMQRLSPDQLTYLTGIEYYLHLVQEPVLFVICKRRRHSPTQVSPLSYYYVIHGTVHQAPDLGALINSRVHTALHGLNKVIQSLMSCVRYHPATGSYSWDEDADESGGHEGAGSDSTGGRRVAAPQLLQQQRDQAEGTVYQYQRVDTLLGEWANRFPMPVHLPPVQVSQAGQGTVTQQNGGTGQSQQARQIASSQASSETSSQKDGSVVDSHRGTPVQQATPRGPGVPTTTLNGAGPPEKKPRIA